jgi:hypothetical protein
MAPSSLFLKAVALAVVGVGSGAFANLLPYVVDDVYQGKFDGTTLGTGFFDMFDFFTVSPRMDTHVIILIVFRPMIPPTDTSTM